MPSKTPSLSVFLGHPNSSTVAPFGVSGHLSIGAITPSLSESACLMKLISMPTINLAKLSRTLIRLLSDVVRLDSIP
ncbi:MAG: hypothetical protein PF541_05565 [Prolixibacteraceae bacterium]|nr:hypothetical protein [Prolixibacteraceae bacterium]